MFGHKQSQHTHRQQFMSELSESVGAMRRAAGHLALGTAERLTPSYDRARVAAGRGWVSTRQTITPIYQQIREGAVHARSRPSLPNGHRHRGGRMRGLASLLAAGAAVGAVGAAVARRRRAQRAEWEEYDPVTGETRYMGSRYADETSYGHRSARERVAAGAATMADSVSSRAGRIADTLHDRSETMREETMQRPGQGAPTAPEPMPRAAGPSGGPMTGSMTGPSGNGPGVPGTTPNPPGMTLGPGMPTGSRDDRLGDPALGFPDES